MNQTRQHFFPSLVIVFGCLVFFTFSVNSQEPRVQVVVNPSVDAKTISEEQVRRIFTMRQTNWANGQTITVFVLSNQNQTHQIFSTKVLGMFPYQLDRIWNKLVYSGLGEEPIKVNSEQEMIERVGQVKGAIGYISPQNNDNTVQSIKVLGE